MWADASWPCTALVPPLYRPCLRDVEVDAGWLRCSGASMQDGVAGGGGSTAVPADAALTAAIAAFALATVTAALTTSLALATTISAALTASEASTTQPPAAEAAPTSSTTAASARSQRPVVLPASGHASAQPAAAQRTALCQCERRHE